MMESTAEPIYFYKAHDPYGCFSNFSLHPIHCEALDWPTVEHFYQAHKFLPTHQQDLIDKIRAAPTPEIAAALGRDPQHPKRPDWEDIKRTVMWQGVWTKFKTHPDIAQILLATGDAAIIENSPVDYYWGCGADGSGHNYLGKVLMQVRSQLRQG
ncbi:MULTISPECIES: NADAR family protein [Cyanophyceae]|uniref:NADAR family protein n=1 Tax=Cyanophyceae TaxID=3028117 RepID=UPI0008105064|nr:MULTISPECIES: NADAR family protein [Cyanophyceae]ANV87749.1 Swarming motility protein ybiA [Picosynechococcus sp. PCC 7117]